MDDHSKLFLESIEEELILSNVYYHLPKKEAVGSKTSSLKTSGFFRGDPDPELVVATKKPLSSWFPILIHEYCHYLQWKEQSPLWRHHQELTSALGGDALFDWIEGKKDLEEETLDELFSVTIALEKDAEERAVEIIRTRNLPVDIESYLKGARSYLLFYQFVRKHRLWFSAGKEPYGDEVILKMMEPSLESLELTSPIENRFKELTTSAPGHRLRSS